MKYIKNNWIFYYLPTREVKNILNNIEIINNMFIFFIYVLFGKNIRIIISTNGLVNIITNE